MIDVRSSGCSSDLLLCQLIASPMAQMPELTIWDIEDISTRQDDLQTALRQRDELAAFIDNAPVGLYSVRPDGQLVFVNRTLATWLGSSPERIVATGTGLSDILQHAEAREGETMTPEWEGGES